MRELGGRTAIVTGGSRGIGPHVGHALARAGAEVMLVARDGTRLAEVARSIEEGGGRATWLAVDLAEDGAIDQVVAAAHDRHGRVDLLVNNAGIETLAPFQDTSPDELTRTLHLDLGVPLLLTRAVVPEMLARGDGHVVFMSSLMGKAGNAFHATYSASKAGLIGLTQALRREYAHTGVGFSAVCPGLVRDAGMFADMADASGARRHRATTLLGTVDPDRVAAAVVRAVRRDTPEVIVTGTPVRPLLALAALAPRALGPLVDAFGVTAMYRDAATRSQPPAPARTT